MTINQENLGEAITSIQERIAYLKRKIEEYKSSKRTLEKENRELDIGYSRILTAKKRIIEEDENYVREIKKKARFFSPALKCVHSFYDSVQGLVNGIQNQNSLSLLQDALDKIKKQSASNEASIERLNNSIYTASEEIKRLRIRLDSLGG